MKRVVAIILLVLVVLRGLIQTVSFAEETSVVEELILNSVKNPIIGSDSIGYFKQKREIKDTTKVYESDYKNIKRITIARGVDKLNVDDLLQLIEKADKAEELNISGYTLEEVNLLFKSDKVKSIPETSVEFKGIEKFEDLSVNDNTRVTTEVTKSLGMYRVFKIDSSKELKGEDTAMIEKGSYKLKNPMKDSIVMTDGRVQYKVSFISEIVTESEETTDSALQIYRDYVRSSYYERIKDTLLTLNEEVYDTSRVWTVGSQTPKVVAVARELKHSKEEEKEKAVEEKVYAVLSADGVTLMGRPLDIEVKSFGDVAAVTLSDAHKLFGMNFEYSQERNKIILNSINNPLFNMALMTFEPEHVDEGKVYIPIKAVLQRMGIRYEEKDDEVKVYTKAYLNDIGYSVEYIGGSDKYIIKRYGLEFEGITAEDFLLREGSTPKMEPRILGYLLDFNVYEVDGKVYLESLSGDAIELDKSKRYSVEDVVPDIKVKKDSNKYSFEILR